MANGLCECGCGFPAGIAPRNSKRSGWVKGQPQRYIVGHAARGRIVGQRKRARYELRDGYAVLFIHTRKGDLECLVDVDDLPSVLQLTWSATGTRRKARYAVYQTNRLGVRNAIPMHRFLLGDGDGQIDHIDRNGLNNRRSNLRRVTASINCYNRLAFSVTGLRGSYKEGDAYRSKPYKAAVSHNGKKLNLGRFATPEEAHRTTMSYLIQNKLIPTSGDA